MIYTCEHRPVHVHITGAGQARINLLGADGKPEVVTSIGIKLAEKPDTAMRATKARCDRTTGRVTIDLTNGCAYAFPAQLVQDLNGATDDRHAAVEVDGLGFVLALVSGVFGTRAWMAQELARRAGQTTSPAKAAAARANGAKGGRPRKVAN